LKAAPPHGRRTHAVRVAGLQPAGGHRPGSAPVPDSLAVLLGQPSVTGWARLHRYFHSTRADLLRRASRGAEARDAYRRALDLAQTEPERRFLAGRLAETAR